MQLLLPGWLRSLPCSCFGRWRRWWRTTGTILPAPWELVPLFARELQSGALVYHLSATLMRVLAAFVLAMGLGVGIGWHATGRRPDIDRWLDPWLIVFLNLPALVLIVLCYLWIGLNETAAILAVTLNKIPNVVTIIREGARSFSPELTALAQVHRLSRIKAIRHIYIPQNLPRSLRALRGRASR